MPPIGASKTDTFSLAEPVRVGTRASALALSQATEVAECLSAAGIREGYELVEIGHDGGDPSVFAGGQVMTNVLRQALLDGRCDVAVHMLKDLPTDPVPGLTLGAYIKRLDPREALCARNGWTLATLPEGAKVAISSPLRRAQLLEVRPDLTIVGIRGPIESRLERVADGEIDATVLAWAVLHREGKLDAVTQVLDPAVMLPTPCQGVLVVEVREDAPAALKKALRRIDHACTRLVSTAERALQADVAAATKAPFGALARLIEGVDVRTRLELSAVVAGPDQALDLRRARHVTIDDVDNDDDVEANLAAASRLGSRVAKELLDAGAGALPQHLLAKPPRTPRPRVLVQRISDEFDPMLAAAIMRAGGEPVMVTLTRTIPAPDAVLDAVLDRLPSADRVGMTSAEAVTLLEERAHERHTSLAQILEGTPVAAFGATTSAALVAASVTVDMLPSLDASVGNLLSVWPSAPVSDHLPVALLPGSANASPLLAAGLRDLGWLAEDLPVYERVTADPTAEHEKALESGWPEAVIVTSRSAVQAIEELFGLPPKDVRVVAVGRIPARDALSLGLHVDAISPSPKPSAIAAAALEGLVPAPAEAN
ncbi:MAG TPA: hydroxymethylbilane synthase [Propionibacteriaceae bacterium]